MAAVQAGGDRQILHEVIRVHSQAAGRQVKEFGRSNDLIERLQNDPAFEKADLSNALEARRFVGRAPEQVDGFVSQIVEPIREKYANDLGSEATELRV